MMESNPFERLARTRPTRTFLSIWRACAVDRPISPATSAADARSIADPSLSESSKVPTHRGDD